MIGFITSVTLFLQTLFVPLGLLSATVCVVTLLLGLALSAAGLMRWAKYSFFGAIIGLGGGQILTWVRETAQAVTG